MFPTVSPKKTSERKIALHKEAKAYKKIIDGQVSDLKSEAARIGTTALIVGTTLATVYVIFSLFTSDDEPKEKKTEIVENSTLPVIIKAEKESWLISSIKGYMVAFLMAIAKDKIVEAMTILKENNDQKSTK